MRKASFLKLAAVIALVEIIGIRTASAAGGTVVSLANPLGVNSFTDVVTKVTGLLFTIAVPLTAIMALVGGFQMITSAGNPEKFSSGKKTLLYAAIGFGVVVLSGGVVAIIRDILGT